MASTPEMIRLMRHAADLLDAAEPPAILRKAADSLTYSQEKSAAAAALVKAAVAQATGAAMLRMVAAAMDDGPTPARAPWVVARDGGRPCETCDQEITRGQAYETRDGVDELHHVHCPDRTRSVAGRERGPDGRFRKTGAGDG